MSRPPRSVPQPYPLLALGAILLALAGGLRYASLQSARRDLAQLRVLLKRPPA